MMLTLPSPPSTPIIVFLERFCKMVGVLPPNILDTKFVDTKSEGERLLVMCPKARCDVALLVAVLVESSGIYKDLNCVIVIVVNVVGMYHR
jgi:hypothetical protein